MKTKEDCLKNKLTMTSEAGPFGRIVWYAKEDILNAMEEYAAQFIKPTTCYACNGTGMTDMQSQCETCKGVGMLVILPTITNTKT